MLNTSVYNNDLIILNDSIKDFNVYTKLLDISIDILNKTNNSIIINNVNNRYESFTQIIENINRYNNNRNSTK